MLSHRPKPFHRLSMYLPLPLPLPLSLWPFAYPALCISMFARHPLVDPFAVLTH